MKAGIVADNYKVPLFETELAAAGFVFEKFPFTDETTTIRVEYEQHQFDRLRALVTKLNRTAFQKKAGEN